MSAADSITERYAAVMNSLIADCTHLEDRVAELENQLRATARERDDAVAAQTAAERERDQALQSRAAAGGSAGRTEGFIGRQPLGANSRRRCGRRFKEKHTGAALRHTC